MRTENIHGYSSILLAFAIVLSMAVSVTLTAPPVVAGLPTVIEEPGGTTITTFPGGAFTIQFKLQWNEPASLGYFSLGIYWDSPKSDSSGTANENFTLVSASAYFEDNLQAISVGTTWSQGVSPTDPNMWRYSLVVDHTAGDGGDDNFYVDIVMRAQGLGGVNHIAPDNHIIKISGTIDVAESGIVSYTPPDPDITIEVLPWTGGVIVQGKANMYNIDAGDDMPPYVDYTAGSTPPIMVGQVVDSGAFVAGGISASSRDGRWNDQAPLNPNIGLDNLLDAAFQWMVPGATDVLWWDHSDVYNNTTRCSELVAALELLGYTVDGDDRPLENMYSGFIDSYSGTITENIIALDNSYGIEDKPDQTGDQTYNGTSYNMLVGNYQFTGDNKCRIFMQWDLDAQLSAPSSITSATLMYEQSRYADDNITVGIYEAGDNWDELTLTWNLMPDQGAKLGEHVLTDSIDYVWYSLDVTSYVQGEFASDNIVSIKLESENELNMPAGARIAAEEGGYGPRLEITYEGTIYEEYDKGLENYDIFVINQLQRDYDDRHVGGDPDKLEASEISIIESWVRGGGGLLIDEGSDFGGHCYCRIANKILDALDSDWNFQHDQATDSTDNWYGDYSPVCDVLTTNPVGAAYEQTTGMNDIGLYSCDTLYEPPVTWDVDVSVSPAVVSQPEATTVNFDATVTNLGAGDRFMLSVSDDLGWNPQVSPSYVDLGVGEWDNTVSVSVDIPAATPYCTYDTVYVTATSVTDNTVSDVGTAQAHSTGAPLTLRGVSVVIEPEYQEAVLVIDRDAVKKRYDPLTFKVIVTNEGELWDKYILVPSTDSDKILEIWPTELFLQPGQSDFAVLSVTVPENEVGSNYNDIRVDAYGTFSTGTGDDTDNAAGFDTCVVHIKEAWCVRVDVWPFQVQSATPGSKVRWIARVKNLGNVPNTYAVDVTNVVSDANKVYDPANIVVTPQGPITLPPCNWEQVIIDLDVPEGLEMSTRIRVTVHVYSTIYEGCEDWAEVEVHVVRGIPLIPQGVIKLEVETEIIAIQVWPTYWDFGVLDEAEVASTPADYFTVRNIGNEPVNVTIAGNDAWSSPGELTTTWMLSDLGDIGLDRYVLECDSTTLTHAGVPLVNNLLVSEEFNFDLTLKAPSSITVPSRMWTLVNLTAVEA